MGIGIGMPILVPLTYILKIIKTYKYKESNIGDKSFEILSRFMERQYLSTYMIYSISKRSGLKIDYKNTYKRIKRLESLGFIEQLKAEEVKEEDRRHGARYYRISETGIFQLFLRIDILFTLFDILQNNENSLIFQSLLYPYFEKETFNVLNKRKVTIDNLYDSFVEKWIIIDVYTYLRNCCIEINQAIKFINENKKGPEYIETVKGRRYLETKSNRMNIFRDNLALDLLGLFDESKNEEWLNALTVLANDNRFMKVVDTLHTDFEKCYGAAMRMGKRI
jgi:DNA-binding PadR family transcriptional regulator